MPSIILSLLKGDRSARSSIGPHADSARPTKKKSHIRALKKHTKKVYNKINKKIFN